jgi:hypothetical protein
MIAFAGLLVAAAEAAGMKVPPNPDKFDLDDYPHFFVFTIAQLGQPMPTSYSHWTNAKTIAAVPDDKIRFVTFAELLDMGFEVGYTIP